MHVKALYQIMTETDMAENRNRGYEYAEAGWEGSGGPVGGGQPAVGHSVAGGVEPRQVAQQEAQREAQLAVRVRRLCGGAPPRAGQKRARCLRWCPSRAAPASRGSTFHHFRVADPLNVVKFHTVSERSDMVNSFRSEIH